MSVIKAHFSRKYLREETLPTLFCPGCFNGILMNALAKAFEELGIDNLKKFVFVSGIGCSSWIPSPYIKADSLHTLHGRAIPVAIGVKLAKPELEVVVIAGDGDLASIGLGHLIHAARRNVDLVTILVNNYVYGMTRGQVSPTTPIGLETPTTPYGAFEYPLDVCKVIEATNANYVARWTIAHFTQLKESIKYVFSKIRRGFRFIEVIAPCTTYISRRLRKTPADTIKDLLRTSILLNKAKSKELGKLIVGVFKSEDKPGYVELYKNYIERAKLSNVR